MTINFSGTEMIPGLLYTANLDMKKVLCLRESLRHHINIKYLQISPIYQLRRQTLHTTTRCSAVPLPHLAAPGPPPSPPEHHLTGSNSSFDHRKRKIDQLAKRRALEYRSGKGFSVLQKRFWKEVNIRESGGM